MQQTGAIASIKTTQSPCNQNSISSYEIKLDNSFACRREAAAEMVEAGDAPKALRKSNASQVSPKACDDWTYKSD